MGQETADLSSLPGSVAVNPLLSRPRELTWTYRGIVS